MVDDAPRYADIIAAVRRNEQLWERIVAHKRLRKIRPPTEHDIEYLGDLYKFVITIDPTFRGTEFATLLQTINAQLDVNREG